MDTKTLFKLLENPKLYGVDKVKIIQTHISFVVIGGEFVYKVKKPVNFGFLDFSTLEKRKFYCEEELRLNSRTSSGLYLGVVKITEEGSGIRIGGEGKIVDYAVKMKYVDNRFILKELIREDKITISDIKKLAETVAEFHKTADSNATISEYGKIDKIRFNTDENFEQTKEFIGLTITKKHFDFIKKRTDEFFDENKELFQKRISDKRIIDSHGDLHTGNIFFMNNKFLLFDCIEFNERFRYADAALDVSFLAMDLDHMKKRVLSKEFVNTYIEKSGDADIIKLVDFYKCYLAYVRGKVTSFLLNDRNISEEDKENHKAEADKYFMLAYEYATNMKKSCIKQKRPLLFITCGLSGSGKSRWARIIANYFSAVIRSSDVQRKKALAMYKDGELYSKESRDRVYEIIIEKGKKFLDKNRNVMLDATFLDPEKRDAAKKAAEDCNADLIVLYFTAPEDMIKKRLDKRAARGRSVSDADWKVYLKQKENFTAPSGKNIIEIDTSADDEQEVLRRIEKLIESKTN